MFHDACHFALLHNQKYNNIISHLFPEFSQPFDWYHQHNIGHHIYTNIENKDPDIFYKSKLNYLRIPLDWIFSYVGIILIIPIQFNITKKYRNITELFKKRNFKELSLYIFMKYLYLYIYIYYPFTNFNFKNALFYVFVSRLIYSLLFMFNSQITHLHDNIIKNYDNSNNEIDWYKHQVETSTNHTIEKNNINKIVKLFSGSLNYQIEHHLFPNINHCHLENIQPIVEDVCNKHNVKYKKFRNCFDALFSYCKYIFTW